MMDSKYQLVIISSICLLYCFLVFFWGERYPTPQIAIRRHYRHGITTMAPRNELANQSLPQRSAQLLISSKVNSNIAPGRTVCLWKVQFWNHPYQPTDPSIQKGQYYCPETKCNVTFMHSSSYDVMRSSHVIILHHIGSWNMEKINSVRRPDQIIVYMSRESPFISIRKQDLIHFNWTMTYNSRSEIPIPYGKSVGDLQTKDADTSRLRTKNWAQGKTGLAIWIVSNCHTTGWPRTSYGITLANFMKIDVFGRCGAPCGDEDSCHKRIFSYKFYIAFENSMCDDYITEKFWKNALQHDAVPVVYGAPKRDYQRLAPKNSFIHISDFRNMSSLATYIDTLDKNDTLYNRYFEWRLNHRAEILGPMDVATVSKGPLCDISKRLVENSERSDVSNRGDRRWFEESCGNVPRPDLV